MTTKITDQGSRADQTSQELATKLARYRLNEIEYRKICQILGRPPRGVEWALFSAMWSEHCSYKSSRLHLKKLFFASPRVLESFGENAGVIDLGEGERIAFKMESHNHPSFIEPTQGAATGVGGILRDIFTMGARPILLADYLCFGDPQAPRMAELIEGVVRGIGSYGNCVGVPTITGQTEFHSSYNGNILVNAMALGLFRSGDPIVSSKARGVGNLVMYVGARTGRDGIHGAAMASQSFAKGSGAMRPTVQIGDPFYEKLLIESCLEVMKENLVVAIQDMGAAGLTSSSFEMAAKGGVGFSLHLDKVPLREPLEPEEILLSESQERMLLVCEPGCQNAIEKVFNKWGLTAVVIGEVIEGENVKLYWRQEEICCLDPKLLTEEAPLLDRPYNSWQPTQRVESTVFRGARLPVSHLISALLSPSGCSRQELYEQYDQRVGGKTHRDASAAVAVVRLPDSGRFLGVVVGARPPLLRWDVKEGGRDAILHPSLHLAVKGFEPLAVTDCLNFGNPEKPEVMTEFVAAVEGLKEAAFALKTPIISGNVSFYNETLNKNITSTPATGIVGLAAADHIVPQESFQREGSQVWWLRLPQVVWGGSFAELVGDKVLGSGEIDVGRVALWLHALTRLVGSGGVAASRAVGKFGLLFSLARMAEAGRGVALTHPEVIARGQDLLQETLYEVIIERVLIPESAGNPGQNSSDGVFSDSASSGRAFSDRAFSEVARIQREWDEFAKACKLLGGDCIPIGVVQGIGQGLTFGDQWTLPGPEIERLRAQGWRSLKTNNIDL